MISETVVYRHLKKLGVPANMEGYSALKFAILQCAEHNLMHGQMTTELYPAVAEYLGSTPSRVERVMRHAVGYVLENTPREVLHEYFGNIWNARSGKLTNSQFITGVAEYIRMEDMNND